MNTQQQSELKALRQEKWTRKIPLQRIQIKQRFQQRHCDKAKLFLSA